MKLYELPRDTRFTINGDESKTVFCFDHIDGAYSVCYLGDATVHLSANTEVAEIK